MGISLSGLASGMDTNAMITALMKLEKLPYDNLNNVKTDRSKAQEVFKSVNLKLLALKNAASDLNYRATFQAKSASNSDDTVLRATASTTAAAGSYKVDISQLAQAHSIRSDNELLAAGTALDSKDQSIQFHYQGNTVQVLLDGDTNEENLNKIAAAVNSGNLGIKASVVENKPGYKTLVLTSKETGEASEIKFGTSSTAGDKSTYISGLNSSNVADDTALIALGLNNGDDSMNVVQAAQNAKFKINGLNVETTSNNVSNVISGVTFNLLKGDNSTSTVTVGVDGDKVTEKVEAFVNAYNDVVSTIRANTSKEMGLQSDPTLRALDAQLSNWFNRAVGPESTPVPGEDATLRYMFQIGLEIDKGITRADSMNGTISFDKDKFKARLAANPDEVYNLFAADHAGDDKDGIAQYFSGMAMNSWTSSVTGIITTRVKGYDSEISTLTDQMTRMDERIKMKEDRLRKQFAAMETALSGLQSQQQWMSNQLAALTASLG